MLEKEDCYRILAANRVKSFSIYCAFEECEEGRMMYFEITAYRSYASRVSSSRMESIDSAIDSLLHNISEVAVLENKRKQETKTARKQWNAERTVEK